MCDRIDSKDPKYKEAEKLIIKDGCLEENKSLDLCLIKYNKNWKFCQEETIMLKKCLLIKK